MNALITTIVSGQIVTLNFAALIKENPQIIFDITRDDIDSIRSIVVFCLSQLRCNPLFLDL